MPVGKLVAQMLCGVLMYFAPQIYKLRGFVSVWTDFDEDHEVFPPLLHGNRDGAESPHIT